MIEVVEYGVRRIKTMTREEYIKHIEVINASCLQHFDDMIQIENMKYERAEKESKRREIQTRIIALDMRKANFIRDSERRKSSPHQDNHGLWGE